MGEARRRKLQAEREQAISDFTNDDGVWPLSNVVMQGQLEEWFVKHGIDPTRPGIHDTAEFLRAEKRDPKTLNLVARLVEARHYSADELVDAERKILAAALAVGERVARDGRKGLCVTASGILSRMLDEMGVWNYTAKSNLAIHFPPGVSDESRYFYSVDVNYFTAPHAVVVAPPFTVVDVTAKHQAYDQEAMTRWLPNLVTTKMFRPYEVTPDELVSPEVRAELLIKHGITAERYLATEKTDMLELMRLLPSREIRLNGGRLGYGIVAVGGYQEQLESLDDKNCSIDGLTPMQIFLKDVAPKL